MSLVTLTLIVLEWAWKSYKIWKNHKTFILNEKILKLFYTWWVWCPRSEKKYEKNLRWPPQGAKCPQSFKNHFFDSGSHLGIFSYFFSERGQQNYHICKVLEFFLRNWTFCEFFHVYCEVTWPLIEKINCQIAHISGTICLRDWQASPLS
jgi:hypothetical protein